MSSFVRRFEIRLLKAKGFVRQTHKVGMDRFTKEPRLEKIRPAPWPSPRNA